MPEASEPPIEPIAPGLVAVVGASAGGLVALQRLLRAIPGSFSGALCIVMHLARHRPSYLARILDREAAIPVVTPTDGQPLAAGHVFVAPPDHHLVIDEGRLRLLVGPNENGHRPAVDTLFRSAALDLGPGAIGVVLSGSLDDGAAGLREIKARGGRALVQEPADAAYPGMPLAALHACHPDLLAPAPALGEWLAAQPSTPRPTDRRPGSPAPPIRSPQPLLTCPDCHGPLHEVFDGDLLRFDCVIGHRWSIDSLESFQRTDVEDSLWAALRALEERGALDRLLATRSARDHREGATAAFTAAAEEAEHQAAALREIIRRMAPDGVTGGD